MPILPKHAFLSALMCALTAGCVAPTTEPAWTKTRATAPQFYQAREQCLQHSRRRESYAGAGDVVITDWDAFAACLNSQGWFLQSLARN